MKKSYPDSINNTSEEEICITIVLINGCFHNGPVKCRRLVIMAQGRLY